MRSLITHTRIQRTLVAILVALAIIGIIIALTNVYNYYELLKSGASVATSSSYPEILTENTFTLHALSPICEVRASKRLTASDMHFMSNISSIRYLKITVTSNNITGLLSLRKMAKLETLVVYIDWSSGVAVDDNTLNIMFNSNYIPSVHLCSSMLSDDNARIASKLIRCTELGVYGDALTDKGMQYITAVNTIRKMHLVSENITDESTHLIAKMSGLEYVDLRGTKITEIGKQIIHAQVPGCVVMVESIVD